MHQLALELQLQPGPVREQNAEAWFVPGATATSWIETAVTVGELTSVVRIRVVPDNQGESIGALISGVDLTGCRQCLPYVRVADILFVPQTSQISPDVASEELRQLLRSDVVDEYVWHPSAGLIGFESNQVLKLDQLLSAAPVRNNADWSFAEPGAFLNDRLHSVTLHEPVSLESILQDGRDDIGQNAGSFDDLPRSPDESAMAGAQDFARTLMTPMAKSLRWLTSLVPPTASSPTWVNAVDNWARRMLSASGFSQSRRLNELKRLLSMLDADPDRGLRHALPFGGDVGRGKATPTDQLGNRLVEYGMSGGSGPADYWDVPYEVQFALRRRYRELAQREFDLGRFRRAAYIYATLLDDYNSAAQVLFVGRFYREAAEIYEKRLNDIPRAAQSLRKGALWAEAIELYERLNKWTEVAEIHEHLQNHELAVAAWQKAVDVKARTGDHIGAAKIQETKLADISAAGRELHKGWSRSAKPQHCLTELFALNSRHEKHQSSHDLIQSALNKNHLHATSPCDVAEVLASQSREYPNAGIRDAAFRSSRNLVAENLRSADKHLRQRFLSVLESLVPDDRLLKRDCQRFDRQQNERPRQAKTAGLRHLDRFSLRQGVRWQTAVRTPARFFAAGTTDEKLFVASWMPARKPFVTYNEFDLRTGEDSKILMAPVPGKSYSAYLHVTDISENALTDLAASISGAFVRPIPRAELAVAGFGVSQAGSVYSLTLSGPGVLSRYDRNGLPLGDFGMPFGPVKEGTSGFVHSFSGGTVVCVLDRNIAFGDPTTGDGIRFDATVFALSQPACHMAAFEDASAPRFAVLFEEGGVVNWLKSSQQRPIAAGLTNPVGAFTSSGNLLLIDVRGKMEVYQTRGEQALVVASHSHSKPNAIAVLPCGPNEVQATRPFLTCHADGTIDLPIVKS